MPEGPLSFQPGSNSFFDMNLNRWEIEANTHHSYVEDTCGGSAIGERDQEAPLSPHMSGWFDESPAPIYPAPAERYIDPQDTGTWASGLRGKCPNFP